MGLVETHYMKQEQNRQACEKNGQTKQTQM